MSSQPEHPSTADPDQPSLVHPVAPGPELLEAAAGTLRMLAEPTRLHLLWQLVRRPENRHRTHRRRPRAPDGGQPASGQTPPQRPGGYPQRRPPRHLLASRRAPGPAHPRNHQPRRPPDHRRTVARLGARPLRNGRKCGAGKRPVPGSAPKADPRTGPLWSVAAGGLSPACRLDEDRVGGQDVVCGGGPRHAKPGCPKAGCGGSSSRTRRSDPAAGVDLLIMHQLVYSPYSWSFRSDKSPSWSGAVASLRKRSKCETAMIGSFPCSASCAAIRLQQLRSRSVHKA